MKPAPKSAEESAQEAEDREEKKSADRWLVRWTAALFFATTGLILATGTLGVLGFFQLRDMRASIEATKIQAQVAKASYAAIVNILKPKFQVVKRGDKLDEIKIIVGLINSGNSFTENAFSQSAITFVESENQFSFESLMAAMGAARQAINIGPHAEFDVGAAGVGNDHVHKCMGNAGFVFLGGWVEYNDIFPDTLRHRLEFCYRLVFTGDRSLGIYHCQFIPYGELQHNRHYDVPRQPVA